MFNPLYCKDEYTYWWHDIGCCRNQVWNRGPTSLSQTNQEMHVRSGLALYVVSRLSDIRLPRQWEIWVLDRFCQMLASICTVWHPWQSAWSQTAIAAPSPTYSSMASETKMTQPESAPFSRHWTLQHDMKYSGCSIKTAAWLRVLVLCFSAKFPQGKHIWIYFWLPFLHWLVKIGNSLIWTTWL